MHSSVLKCLGLSLLFAAAAAVAQEATTRAEGFDARVDARQAHQQQRIGQGVADGSLTAHEAARLQHQQVGVAQHEQRIDADGRITRKEAYSLEQHQDRSSWHIYRQRHDRQLRGG